MPAPVQAVLLDVGGVFHLPDHDRIVAALARAEVTVDPAGLDRAHYAGVAALDDFTASERREPGTPTSSERGPSGPSEREAGDRSIWLAYNRAYARACGAADDRIEAVAEILLSEFTTGGVWTRVIAGSREALQELAGLGVALAIVSNADGSVEAQLRADGICQVGDGAGVPVGAVLDSAVVGLAKPDPKIFELALDRLGVAPDAAIHVGDTPAADVDGARAAGVRPVLVDPHDDHVALDVDRVRSLGEVVELVRAS
jgi:putative hydrolase of the HAD superfamily